MGVKIAYCGWHNPLWTNFLRRYWTVGLFTRKDNTWKVEDIPEVSNYDIIWLYHMGNIPPFIKYIKEMRKRYKDIPIILFLDWESPFRDYPEVFETVDSILHVSAMRELKWSKKHSDKYMFTPVPFEMQKLTPKPTKEKWIGVMMHKGLGSYNNDWQSLSDLNLKILNAEGCKEKIYRPNIIYVPYRSYDLYMNGLSTCYLGFDSSNYNGWSRFVTECAMYNIPVVSNRRIASNLLANPSLCFFDSLEDQRKTIDLLLECSDLRDAYGRIAFNTLREILSYEYNKVKFNILFKELIEGNKNESYFDFV